MPNDEASLKAMKYRELQRVAKEVGVKANLSTVVLLQKILDAKLAAHQRPHVRHGHRVIAADGGPIEF